MARTRTRTLVVTGVVTVLVLAAAVPAVLIWRDRQDRERRQRAIGSFVAAWRAGDLSRTPYSGATGTEVAKQASAILAGLTSAEKDQPTDVELLSLTGAGEGRASARLRVRWTVAEKRTWEYETSAGLVREDGTWRVAWSPSVLHPDLVAGQVLRTSRERAERGRVLGSGGQVLVMPRPVVLVGIEPGRATDPRAAAAQVAAVTGVDAAELTRRVLAASPRAFVDVITLRRADHLVVKARLEAVPGTVFREMTLSLAPTSGFARALLGTVGPATAEIVTASKGRVGRGDLTGLSGIQRRYDEHLSGAPGLTVTAGPADNASAVADATGADTTGTADAGPTKTLFTVAPTAGRDLLLSLDEKVQRAAETALAAAPQPAALVAVRPSTGEVLAVANGGPGGSGYNRALVGRYPPGSTFKIVTTYALLENGLTPATPVPCPPTVTVGGRSFRNAENEVLGTVPFHNNFAHSCNTAFIEAARKITPAQLHEAATALGYGHPNASGVDSFMGSVPERAGEVEHAADAIGQGTILASPLTVAATSAAVASGRYLPPRIVLETPSGTPSPTSSLSPSQTPSQTPSPAPTPLPTGTIRALQSLTAEVVTNGTGTTLQKVPGGPVHGKTGTAEFGSDVPPKSHAWFTGYQGDVAFAVVVEGGGFGGKVAAPLAATFLTALA
ncbi:MAG: hypothetical protein QG622_527 [Actinomycetota bacterium]|nr:hypothetical protein [Actinomycetota bacterium]